MRVLLTGASGQLGAYLIDRLLVSGHDVVAWSGSRTGERSGVALIPVDLADQDSLTSALQSLRPDAILHAAAISSAEAVFRDFDRANAVNILATECLAGWCRAERRRLVYTSTDLIFGGSKPPYREEDWDGWKTILAYGKTKFGGELRVDHKPRSLTARLSLLYGFSRCGRPGFFDRNIEALRRGEPRAFFEDEFRTPLDYATAAEAVVRLLESDATGVVHVGGAERMSRYELMQRAAKALGIDPALVLANRRADVPSPEPRPADVSLDTTRLMTLLPDLRRPSIEEALAGST